MPGFSSKDPKLANFALAMIINDVSFDAIRLKPGAICADPIAGLTRLNSAVVDTLDAELRCKDGDRIVGGGFQIEYQTDEGNVKVSAPLADGQGWRVRMALGPKPRYRVYAVCAPATAIRGWQLVEGAAVTIASLKAGVVKVRCPNRRQRALSVGFELTAPVANGDHFTGTNMPWLRTPDKGRSWRAKVHSGYQRQTVAKLSAICADVRWR